MDNGGDIMSDSPVDSASPSAASGFAAAQDKATAAKQQASGNWNSKKMQEEFDHVKSRLLHSEFNPNDYPDPLLPRPKGSPTAKFPPGAEERLKAFLEKVDSEA